MLTSDCMIFSHPSLIFLEYTQTLKTNNNTYMIPFLKTEKPKSESRSIQLGMSLRLYSVGCCPVWKSVLEETDVLLHHLIKFYFFRRNCTFMKKVERFCGLFSSDAIHHHGWNGTALPEHIISSLIQPSVPYASTVLSSGSLLAPEMQLKDRNSRREIKQEQEIGIEAN